MINLLVITFIVGSILLTAMSVWINADYYFSKKTSNRNKYKSKLVAPDYYKDSKVIDTRIVQAMIANLKNNKLRGGK